MSSAPRTLRHLLASVVSNFLAQAAAKNEQRARLEGEAVKWAKLAALGNWASVLVAIVAGVFIYKQLIAMQTANTISNNNFVQGNRPFLFTDDDFKPVSNWDEKGLLKNVVIKISLQNTGATPALKVSCFADWSLTEQGLGEQTWLRDSFIDIGPNQKGTCRYLAVSRDQLSAMYRTKRPIFFYARAEYYDAFQGCPVRHTNICGRMTAAHDPDIPGGPDTTVIFMMPVASCTNSD